MNVRQGLQRISAVWWGFWGLLAGVTFLVSLFKPQVSDRLELAGVSLFALLAVYVAHRLTCWVVAGFFASQQ